MKNNYTRVIQKMIFWRKFVNWQFLVPIHFHGIFPYCESQWLPATVWLQHSSKYHLLCSTKERHSCRFGATWHSVSDDRFVIFSLTIPLRRKVSSLKKKSPSVLHFISLRNSWAFEEMFGGGDQLSDTLYINSDWKINDPVSTLNCLKLLWHELLTRLYYNVCLHTLVKDDGRRWRFRGESVSDG